MFNEYKDLNFIDLDKSKKHNFGLKTGDKYWFQIGFDDKEEKTNIKYALNNYDDYINDRNNRKFKRTTTRRFNVFN